MKIWGTISDFHFLEVFVSWLLPRRFASKILWILSTKRVFMKCKTTNSHFRKKVFGSKFCIIWSQKKLWKKRKSRNWEATVDSKMCFLLNRMAIPMIFAVFFIPKSKKSQHFTLWNLLIFNGLFGSGLINSNNKSLSWAAWLKVDSMILWISYEKHRNQELYVARKQKI